MSKRYNPPPNWPRPPEGWTPPPGWQPDASWGPPPQGWKLWVDDRNWFARHKVLSAIAAVFLLFVVIGVASGGPDDTPTDSTSDDSTDSSTPSDSESPTAAASKKPTTKAPAEKEKPGIGTAVRDGKFRFTVTKVACGKTLIGSADFGAKAQGEFCLVNLTVKNIGDEPQTLFGDNQKLFIGKREYSADTEAGIYLDGSKSFIEEINPGNTLKGVVVFDVPKGAKPDKIELHDSAFSGGADVRL